MSNVKSTNPKDMVGTRKVGVSCVPQAVMAEVGLAMLEGASKYGRHNYRIAGVRASVYLDALYRHIFLQWWDEGEDIDVESMLSHITKGISTLVVMRDAMIQGLLVDDRPPKSKPFMQKLNVAAGEVIDRHADKKPRHYTIKDTRKTS
jgi:hypothetical protein